MPRAPKEFHLSSNGDRWFLDRDEATRHGLVVHQANEASGGTVTRLSVVDFLRSGHGPEQQELLRLIGSLAD